MDFNRKPYSRAPWNDGEVRQAILAVAGINGGNTPTKKEFDILKKKVGITLNVHNFRVSRYPETSTYLELIDILGLPLPKSMDAVLYSKLKEWGFPFRREFPVRVGGKLYRVDYELDIGCRVVYLELDGSSHRTPLAKAHVMDSKRCGIPPETLFKRKMERDSVLDDYFKSIGEVLIRKEPHSVLSCVSREDFLSFISPQLDGVQAACPARFKPILSESLLRSLIDKSTTHGEIALEYGINKTTVIRYCKQYGIKNSLSPESKLDRFLSLEGELRVLLESGLSIQAASRKLGIAVQTIARRFRWADAYRNRGQKRIEAVAGFEMIQDWVNSRRTIRELALKLDISESGLKRRAKRLGVTQPTTGKFDDKILAEYATNPKQSYVTTAAKIGCGVNTVKRRLRHYGRI